MTRLVLALLLVTLLGAARAAADPARAAAFAANARLARTVNFGDMLESPREGDWGLRLEDRFFDLARAAGFTAVRLPVRWTTRAGRAAPYTVDPAFLRRVDGAVAGARRRGLAIILDFHHNTELEEDPAGQRERFLAIWRQIAEHERKQPGDVLFEVLNEPSGALDAVWNDLQARALRVIRASNPRRVVIVGAGGWNGAETLAGLRLPDDPHLIVTFHAYTPLTFTHQGADWVTPTPPTGVTWPGEGLHPVRGWQNWSWDLETQGTSSGLRLTPRRPWGALYLHRDTPLRGVREVAFTTDRRAEVRVVCQERNVSGSDPPGVNVVAQPGRRTRVTATGCGGGATLRDLWLMPIGDTVQPPLTVSGLEVVTPAGTLPLLGTAADEAAWPLRVAAAWARAHGRPLFLGEFGAYGRADPASRVRWAAFVRAEAERLGMSWGWWELASGFGVYDPKQNVWNRPLLRALLPTSPLARP
ncbi:glycoside hydrolase family 5 protein [Deinococcus aestuarii]|uniref:glycoside hydrolase family 5 protein n=1 Tax=Deinococcus aestuarii TaxID=2774531 RepID=UPI001C0E7429|nr:glycoside hydrolase family 5 protein [Deinococcus aestuarii]